MQLSSIASEHSISPDTLERLNADHIPDPNNSPRTLSICLTRRTNWRTDIGAPQNDAHRLV
jgi:hypothetical protein